MDKIDNYLKLPKPTQEEIDALNRFRRSEMIEVVIQTTQAQKYSPMNFTDIQRKINTNSPLNLSKSRRGRNASQLIFRGHCYSDTKTRQKHRKKTVDLFYQYIFKNPQQNTNNQIQQHREG